MTALRWGRLASADQAPAEGERVDELVSGPVTIEHILSGELSRPLDFVDERDEWVVVLEGEADLEVGDQTDRRLLELTTGDWVELPAGTPHRLVGTTPGTRWLAVHVRR